MAPQTPPHLHHPTDLTRWENEAAVLTRVAQFHPTSVRSAKDKKLAQGRSPPLDLARKYDPRDLRRVDHASSEQVPLSAGKFHKGGGIG